MMGVIAHVLLFGAISCWFFILATDVRGPLILWMP